MTNLWCKFRIILPVQMSEKLNLFCKNCELSWDDIEIKKCPNCNKDDITLVQSIGDNHRKSKIYLILPLLVFFVSALFISNDYVDIIKTNLIDFVFQKDDVLIEDNEGPRDQWLPNYYDNGQVKQEGETWKGMKDGLWTTYYMNGEIETLGFWKNDKKDSLWTYYDIQGRLETEGVWRQNKQEGIWKYYNYNGNIIKEGVWKNDKKDGLWRHIDAKGGIYKEENWKDGKYVGQNNLNEKTYTSGSNSAKERTSKTTIRIDSLDYLPKRTTIRISSLDYLPKRAEVSPDGKYLYFNVGVNPFKGYIFDLKKKELVGVFQDKGYGLLIGKAFYGKEDNTLYFKCLRNIDTVIYKVFLDTATGINLGRGDFNNFLFKSKGSQEVASQELGKVSLNGFTFNNALRLNNKSVVQIKLDRVVIIQ